MMRYQPQVFRINISDDAIEDLQYRLDRTRWPDQVNDEQWSWGADREYFRELIDYWRRQFDWRGAESRINAFDQYLLDIDGLGIHYIHQRSPHAGALPLIITHGWPGSIVEFLDLIPRLTDPERFGGHAEDAWHVVAPSLPGFGCSPASKLPGMHPGRIAERHARLMAKLGYERYVAQGGDWGSMVSQWTSHCDPEHCRAIHLNAFQQIPPQDLPDPMSVVREHERAWLEGGIRHKTAGMGYYHQQSTRPQTLAYGLNDSPLGLCAWIGEKFHFWTDHSGDLRDAVSWDALLTNISLYWYTGTIASSVRIYKELSLATQAGWQSSPPVKAPTGLAIYPREVQPPPKAWAERRCNLVHWFEAHRGGHFAAMEQPQIFAEDLWRFKQQAKKFLL